MNEEHMWTNDSSAYVQCTCGVWMYLYILHMMQQRRPQNIYIHMKKTGSDWCDDLLLPRNFLTSPGGPGVETCIGGGEWDRYLLVF